MQTVSTLFTTFSTKNRTIFRTNGNLFQTRKQARIGAMQLRKTTAVQIVRYVCTAQQKISMALAIGPCQSSLYRSNFSTSTCTAERSKSLCFLPGFGPTGTCFKQENKHELDQCNSARQQPSKPSRMYVSLALSAAV